MAIKLSQKFEGIPIKSSSYIGGTLGTINGTMVGLSSDLIKITKDKIPDPFYLTTNPTTQDPVEVDADYINESDVFRFARHQDVLTFTTSTSTWVPSATPGFTSAIASAWVIFKGPTGVSRALSPEYGLSTKILASHNVNEVKIRELEGQQIRGAFEINFTTPLNNDVYAVFASGSHPIKTGARNHINAKYVDRNKCTVAWDPYKLKYGSTIHVVVFSN